MKAVVVIGAVYNVVVSRRGSRQGPIFALPLKKKLLQPDLLPGMNGALCRTKSFSKSLVEPYFRGKPSPLEGR